MNEAMAGKQGGTVVRNSESTNPHRVRERRGGGGSSGEVVGEEKRA